MDFITIKIMSVGYFKEMRGFMSEKK